MKLQTQIPIFPQENQIDYSSRILLLGSCFVENIGAKLSYYQFINFQNPFGILYSPVAIEQMLNRVVNQRLFTEEDVFFYNERWHCFEVHSTVSHPDKEVFLQRLNNLLEKTRAYLKTSTHVILTFGTAWVYKHIKTNKRVANCHKIPQQEFVKELLSVAEIEASILNSYRLIKEINPEVIFINTVSPVRHIKDGFIENTRSKAHLITALHQSIKKSSTLNIQSFYFPSYEIMMDELRDYRFYKEDMLHPSNLAVSIIWKRFSEAWISYKANKFQKEIENIQKGLAHKPFNEESIEYKKFSEKLREKISELKRKVPHIDFQLL